MGRVTVSDAKEVIAMKVRTTLKAGQSIAAILE